MNAVIESQCFACSQMVVCEKVGSSIHVLDPMSLQRAEVWHELQSSTPI